MIPPPDSHFRYVDCDVPEGDSLSEWRRRDLCAAEEPKESAMKRLLQRMRLVGRSSA